MKNTLSSILLLTIVMIWMGCQHLDEIQKATGPVPPTQSEMVSGLREALKVGTRNAASALNKTDGYFGNPKLKIPFPPEAVKVENTLRDIGAGQLVDDFVLKMNRGAEKAAAEAAPVFVDAIRQMTITDAKDILTGANDAATNYFRQKTETTLYQKFYPHIKTALNQVKAVDAWTEVTSRYNKIPLVKPVNTDVVDYATSKALDGLFLKLEEEEQKIRENPAARVSNLLKKVFGWAAQQ